MSARLAVTYLAELKNMLLQKNLKISLFIQEQTPDLNNNSQFSSQIIFNFKLNSYCVLSTLHHNFLIFRCRVILQT